MGQLLNDPLGFLKQLACILPVMLLSLTLHEWGHAFAAYKCGDSTARNLGRMTLNPLAHIDPIGFIMILLVGFGWAKPVPVNMYNFKNPKRGMAITALAGPASNVVITVLFLLLYGALYVPLGRSAWGVYVLDMLELTAVMSMGLAVFNMLPVPPLDGSKVLFALLDQNSYRALMRYERYGGIALMALAWTGVLGKPLSAAIGWCISRLAPLSQWACDTVVTLFHL